MISCTSPPEQKLPPAPVSTMARTSLASASARNRSRSSAYDSKVSGFLRSGRLSVMTPDATLAAPLKVLRLRGELCHALRAPLIRSARG